MNLARRATAEGVGTTLLLIAVVGSGIMAERLAGGNVAIALLANAIATGAALVAIIRNGRSVRFSSEARFTAVATASPSACARGSRGLAAAASKGTDFGGRQLERCRE